MDIGYILVKKIVTKHGKKRIKSRVGVKNANYNFRLARIKGKRLNSFSGKFAKFLEYLEIKSKARTIVYNNFIDSVEASLKGMDMKSPVHILKADGGTMPISLSRKLPVESILEN